MLRFYHIIYLYIHGIGIKAMLPYKIVKIDATNWKRPSWDEYFLKLAMLASERATCPRMHCGCVLVKDKYVLATGYNGSLPGTPHCYEDGCMVVNDHCVRTNHAEINALESVAPGVDLRQATLYVTLEPCSTYGRTPPCCEAIQKAGFARVVIGCLDANPHHAGAAVERLRSSGIEVEKSPT